MRHPIPTPIGEARAKLAASEAGVDPTDPYGIRGALVGRAKGKSFTARIAALRTWPPLRYLMAARGLTPADVMALSGCAVKSVHRLRMGQYARVTVGELVAIGHALGVAPSSLVAGLDVRVKDPAADLAHLPEADRMALLVTARLQREARARRRSKSRKHAPPGYELRPYPEEPDVDKA